mgnify:CR=1 FL=1
MNILFISTGGPPIPYGTGHQVHNSGNIECLIQLGHQVDVIILSKSIEKLKTDNFKTKKYHPKLNSCKTIILNNRKSLSLNTLKLYNIFIELIKLYFYPIQYFISKNFESVCKEINYVIINNKIDIIWYEDFYVGVYDFLLKKNVHVIYNMHDNQANAYKNRNRSYFNNKNSFSNILRRLIVNARYQALKRTELKLQKRSKVVLSGSSTDVKHLKGRGVNSILRKIYIKGGPELSLKKRENFIKNNIFNEKKLKIIHIGGIDGSFTSVSLLWFMNQVWPKLLKDLNIYNLELHIIGGGKPSPELKKSFDKPNVLYRGYVDNIWDELVDSFFVVVPGKLITGVRIRVPTIFSMMVPAIGNRVSFDGMFKNKKLQGALFAENSHQYSKNIKMMADDHDYYLKICKDAMAFYLNNHSLNEAAKEINDILKRVMV